MTIRPAIWGIDLHWAKSDALIGDSRAQGATICILKATEGGTFRDPAFARRWEQVRDLGYEARGAYLFTRTTSSPAQWVSNYIATVGERIREEGALPPIIDWERHPSDPAIPSVVWVQEAIERLRDAYGRWPVVYANPAPARALVTHWRDVKLCPLWLAAYPGGNDGSWPGYERVKRYPTEGWPPVMWQYSSGSGVDLNAWLGTRQELAALANRPISQAEPTTRHEEDDDMQIIHARQVHIDGGNGWDLIPGVSARLVRGIVVNGYDPRGLDQVDELGAVEGERREGYRPHPFVPMVSDQEGGCMIVWRFPESITLDLDYRVTVAGEAQE